MLKPEVRKDPKEMTNDELQQALAAVAMQIKNEKRGFAGPRFNQTAKAQYEQRERELKEELASRAPSNTFS